jgi:hypothetical protein
MSCKLTFEFDTTEELLRHVAHLADLEIIKLLIDKPEKKEHDLRGAHIADLHKRAKEYHALHPEVKYHKALSIVSKLNDEDEIV